MLAQVGLDLGKADGHGRGRAENAQGCAEEEGGGCECVALDDPVQ
ncbi:hypothetical protein HMPREF9004_0676 [Schaalia cardiffensis F0333]|uniref:Uncharacterized protein n=1 Tax=Schaalia cardiffensis F0333 TaxID=888050 RepID=N6X5D9_9ACTO|nr:hypothetical protein HMPREF9004_0676 [Schaalia cardiffensis F0333]